MRTHRIIFYSLALLLVSCSIFSKQSSKSIDTMNSNRLTMLVGTYTSGESKGIYTFHFDENSGTTTQLSVVAVPNPSFLTVSADGKRVSAVCESGESNSAVATFSLNVETGVLLPLHTEKTHSADPCYILDGGEWLATANYSGGTISTFPLGKNGELQPLLQQINFDGEGVDKKSHLHCLQLSPDGKYVFACDLGKDRIYRFSINSKKDIVANRVVLQPIKPAVSVAKGSGPRHLTFAPNGKYAYLINEVSGTLVVFRYSKGELTELQTVVADSAGGRGSADIHISPDGKFLYASNRIKEDGIAIFRIDSTNGMLTKVGYCNTAIHPRNFCISPNGKYLLVACRDSDVIQIYKREQTTGLLVYTGEAMDIKLDAPVYVQLVR